MHSHHNHKDQKVVLIVGVSGIVGLNAAQHFLDKGWKVYGISRNKPAHLQDGVAHFACDLLVPAQCRHKSFEDVNYVVFATWAKCANEKENCKVNGAMLENFLVGLLEHAKHLKTVTLVTGTKHYLGPFESYDKQEDKSITPFRESLPRLDVENFYYTQEDILMEKASKHGFDWTVARPHTIIGYAPGNLMNLGTTIAVYATLCKQLGLPFVFPGSKEQYNFVTDMTDASLLAEHLFWTATNPRAANQAFNVVNGDVIRWKFFWTHIAQYFNLTPAPYPGEAQPLQKKFADPSFKSAWDNIVQQNHLKPYKLEELASWWHSDADLGRTTECINDMNKSKELGFVGFRDTEKSIINLFNTLRKEKIIPH